MQHPQSTSAIESLAQCDLFRGLRPREISRIVSRTTRRTVAPRSVVCRAGARSECMYLIMRGRFKVTQQNDSGRESLINILSRGNHFGELGLIQSAQRAADVTALIESEVMEIARDDFHEFMNSIPGFAANVSRTLAS